MECRRPGLSCVRAVGELVWSGLGRSHAMPSVDRCLGRSVLKRNRMQRHPCGSDSDARDRMLWCQMGCAVGYGVCVWWVGEVLCDMLLRVGGLITGYRL